MSKSFPEKKEPITTTLHLTQANLQLHVQISTPSLETRMFLARAALRNGEIGEWVLGPNMKKQMVYVRDTLW